MQNARPKRKRRNTEKAENWKAHRGQQKEEIKKKKRGGKKPTADDISVCMTRVNVMRGSLKETPSWKKLVAEVGMHPGKLSELKTGTFPKTHDAGPHLDKLNRWVASKGGAPVLRVWGDDRSSPTKAYKGSPGCNECSGYATRA